MSGETILIVEDEANIAHLNRVYLEREGYHVEWAADGPSGLQEAVRLNPALIVLDIMLPGIDGLEVCQRLRAQRNLVPIIMETARDEDIDKILGLELGADDYLAKPYNPRELVARVKAILRRVSPPAPTDLEKPALQFADLRLDSLRREVTVNQQPVALRTQEFELLAIFMAQPGVAFERERLLALAWGYDFYGQTRTVDVHVAQLRKKLAGSRAKIETVAGIGYKLVEA
jgi:two-component system alkaline phosphatase synthesis response regulator PhoP